MNEKQRCPWCEGDTLYTAYHDEEWGRYRQDEKRLFEFIVLEGAQAGLSWLTILRKREAYCRAFLNFDPAKVAEMTEADVKRLMQCKEIIRNERKIRSAITNARCFLAIEKEFGSFDAYIRSFLPEGKLIDNRPKTLASIPASSPLSDKISRAMHQRGFKFFGTIVCYSFLQATGYINDHLIGCCAGGSKNASNGRQVLGLFY